MTRPEVGQVAEWVTNKREIGALLSLRYSVERGWKTDWHVASTEMVTVPRSSDGGLRVGVE